MADYYAILKRAISGLAEPTGESRRTVYEKARTALVAQLKSFDPPLSASEITQQRLQLEDAIRKVESESAKGLLNQALNRAALPERSTAPTSTSQPAQAPSTAPPLSEPLTQGRPRMTPPTGQPSSTQPQPAPDTPVARPDTDRAPTGQPTRPPLQRPQPTAPTGAGATATGNTTVSTASMRMARPQFEPIVRSTSEPVTGQPPITAAPNAAPTSPTRPPTAPPPFLRDKAPTGNPLARPPLAPPDANGLNAAAYEQEDVTQPVANRALKKAVTEIDRLGTATQESARRARDALALTEKPLDEGLAASGTRDKKGRKPLTPRNDVGPGAKGRNANPGQSQQPRRSSRWPLLIGLVVALAVIALGATALYMKRDLIASYLGTQKPVVELAARAPIEKQIVKATDRILPDDNSSKSTPVSGVKVVTTQPISPGADPASAANPGGRTDVSPATSAPSATPVPPTTNAAPAVNPGSAAAAPASPANPLPMVDVPPISQKASLLEEAADAGSAPVQTAGQVIWQLVRTPSVPAGKPDIVKLQGRVEIPGRGIVLLITMEQNTDAGLQAASHLIKLDFKLPPNFDNKSVARVPGIIMKLAENARGDPLTGATAKITDNLFWIALYAADTDKVHNMQLVRDRGWIDIPIVYETNKRAMLTLEKAGAGDRVFNDALAAWGG